MPKSWSPWLAKAYLAANPSLKGMNTQQLRDHYLQHGAKEGRKLKPDDWAMPYDELPKEFKKLSKEQYEKMIEERPQWKKIIQPRGLDDIGQVEVIYSELSHRFTQDKTPATPEEYVMARHMREIVVAVQRRLQHLVQDIKTHTSKDGWGPNSQNYTVHNSVFPELISYYNTGGTHRKTRIGSWFRWKRGHEQSVQEYEKNEPHIRAFSRGIKSRENMERIWQLEAELAEKNVQIKLAEQQKAAQRASYEKDADLKKTEFEKAVASQKAFDESSYKR